MTRTNVSIPYSFEAEVLDRLDKIIVNLVQGTQQRISVMATVDDIVAKVAAETTMVGGLKTFVQGLQDQIKAIPGITPAMQAQIDGVFTDVSANNAAIASAMGAGIAPPVVPPIVA